jgi:hypothetical protein
LAHGLKDKFARFGILQLTQETRKYIYGTMDTSGFMSAKAEARNNTDTSGPIIPSPFPWVAFLFPDHSRPARSLYMAMLPLIHPYSHLPILSMIKA